MEGFHSVAHLIELSSFIISFLDKVEWLSLFFSSFRHRHMEAVRLRKEKQIYSADEKWVNVLEDCFVSIASVGIFLDSSHSLPCNPLTSCLTGEHWLCLIMRNNPRQNKILLDLREMIHQNQQKEIVNVTPAILASSSFDCSFQCCLMTDWHTKHWTCK